MNKSFNENELDKDYLELLFLELKYYNKKLNILDQNKPLNFQKRKLLKYQHERKEIIDMIEKCNNKINKLMLNIS